MNLAFLDACLTTAFLVFDGGLKLWLVCFASVSRVTERREIRAKIAKIRGIQLIGCVTLTCHHFNQNRGAADFLGLRAELCLSSEYRFSVGVLSSPLARSVNPPSLTSWIRNLTFADVMLVSAEVGMRADTSRKHRHARRYVMPSRRSSVQRFLPGHKKPDRLPRQLNPKPTMYRACTQIKVQHRLSKNQAVLINRYVAAISIRCRHLYPLYHPISHAVQLVRWERRKHC